MANVMTCSHRCISNDAYSYDSANEEMKEERQNERRETKRVKERERETERETEREREREMSIKFIIQRHTTQQISTRP